MDQIKPEFLKKLTKFIVVSIWVLSLLITHNFYVYRFTVQLVTHAVDKKYMFLLCNGLLVLVAKYSAGLIKPIENNWNTTDKTFDYRDFESYSTILEPENNSVHGRGSESFLPEEVTVDEDTKHQETEENEEYDDDDDTLADNAGEEECDLREDFIIDEEEEGEEENIGVMTSTEEEMNKKFDEFIRKMKEELRIEAKRHLILV